MTTDNKQSVLTDAEARAVSRAVGWADRTSTALIHAGANAAADKLRGASEPVAWLKDDGSDAWTDAKKRLASQHAGTPGALVASHYMLPLFAAPQASAEVRNAALEEAAVICDRLAQLVGRSGGAGALAKEIRALKSAPAAEAITTGAGDVELPELPKVIGLLGEHAYPGWVNALLTKYAGASVLADRQQRCGDVLALHVINSARAALDASTEANDDDMSLLVPSHLHAALSLAVDEYDAAIAQQGKEGA